MRFATISVQGEAQFVFATPAQKIGQFFLWKDYAALFPTDKTVHQTLTFLEFAQRSPVLIPHLKKHSSEIGKLKIYEPRPQDYLLALKPLTFRDFYCFEEHVKTMRKSRGADMIPEWYEAPIFYYSNHLSFRGPAETLTYPRDVLELDCELEIAAVVGKEIRNANLEQAHDAILGYSLLNDWTARDIGRWEMKLNMGQTKAKDFSTNLGSFFITPDELESKRTPKGYDLEIELKLNGETITRKNWKGIQFSFEEMLVRGSKNCTIYPGEVIASGTIGGGALAEHNLGKEQKRWLKTGDLIEMRWLPEGPFLSNRVGESE